MCVYDHNERVTSLIELLNQMNKTSINQVASASNGKGKPDVYEVERPTRDCA